MVASIPGLELSSVLSLGLRNPKLECLQTTVSEDDSCATGFLFSRSNIFVSMISAVFPQASPFCIFLLKFKLHFDVNNKEGEFLFCENRHLNLLIGVVLGSDPMVAAIDSGHRAIRPSGAKKPQHGHKLGFIGCFAISLPGVSKLGVLPGSRQGTSMAVVNGSAPFLPDFGLFASLNFSSLSWC